MTFDPKNTVAGIRESRRQARAVALAHRARLRTPAEERAGLRARHDALYEALRLADEAPSTLDALIWIRDLADAALAKLRDEEERIAREPADPREELVRELEFTRGTLERNESPTAEELDRRELRVFLRGRVSAAAEVLQHLAAGTPGAEAHEAFLKVLRESRNLLELIR